MSQAAVPYVCAPVEKASEGESEIGGAPLQKGVETGLQTLSDNTSGFDWLFHALSWALAIVFTPIVWMIGLTDIVADGLGYVVQLLFPLCATFAKESDIAPEPVLLSCMLTVVVVRVAATPIALRVSDRNVRHRLVRPGIERLQKKYSNDTKRQADELTQLLRATKASPAGCVGWVLVSIILYTAVWRLFHGLTIRSGAGTFAPDHVSSSSAVAEYLNQSVFLVDYNMNLTATLGQVGFCWSLVPYLVTVVVSSAVSGLSLYRVFEAKGQAGVAKASVGVTVLLACLLPPMILIIRIVDALYLLLHGRFINRRARRLELRLREDPAFMRWTGSTYSPRGPRTRSHNVSPPDDKDNRGEQTR